MKISDLISKIRAAAQGAKAVAPPPPSRLLEPLPPLPLPEGLEEALIALRRWYRLVMMTTGLFLLLGAVCGLVLVQGLADWWLNLPWLARTFFFVTDIFLLSLLYRSHLHRPLQKKLGLSETALLVEKKWPELNQSVITAVELAEGNARASRGSPQLVEVVLEQARERTAALDFNEVVPTRAFRRWLLCGRQTTRRTTKQCLFVSASASPSSRLQQPAKQEWEPKPWVQRWLLGLAGVAHPLALSAWRSRPPR